MRYCHLQGAVAERGGEFERLPARRHGAVAIARDPAYVGYLDEHPYQPGPIVERPGQRRSLVQQGQASRIFAHSVQRVSQREADLEGQPPGVAGVGNCQAWRAWSKKATASRNAAGRRPWRRPAVNTGLPVAANGHGHSASPIPPPSLRAPPENRVRGASQCGHAGGSAGRLAAADTRCPDTAHGESDTRRSLCHPAIYPPAGLKQAALLGQGHTPCFHSLIHVPQACGDGGSGELDPGHTRGFEQPLVVRDKCATCCSIRVWRLAGMISATASNVARDTPGPMGLVQDLLAYELIDHREQEQRIASGPLVQETGQERRLR